MWVKDLLDTFKTIGLTDVLDIVVMTGLLYLVLLWFKRTKAAFVARGIFIFAMVYVVARQAGMYLTTWMFQGFFAIFVIALVVIFQEELRSFFERIAVWSLRRRASPLLRPKEVEILVRMAGQFSRERIGGLIVLKGHDPLERHVEGGEDLDGKLSEPLLASLFDPHSEGHDGAVIIEGSRIATFGAKLPLSKEFGKLAHVGTRHAAALGLSERTDALSIVVSEERGVISLARDGNIYPVENLEALEEEIATFLRQKAPMKTRGRWYGALKQNTLEKAIAVVIATGLWLVFVQGFSPAATTFKVPVEARWIPEALRVVSIRPAKVNVTLKGLKRDLQLLNPLSLRVSLRLEEAQEGTQKIVISEENLRVPGALQLADVDPPFVELKLTKVPKKSTFLGLFGSPPKEEKQPSMEGEGDVEESAVVEGAETVPTLDKADAVLTIKETPDASPAQ